MTRCEKRYFLQTWRCASEKQTQPGTRKVPRIT